MLHFAVAPGKTNISVTDGSPPPLVSYGMYTSAQCSCEEWLHMNNIQSEQEWSQLSVAAGGGGMCQSRYYAQPQLDHF